MANFDVFNGDADGICSLIQLRLNEPRPEATLVTGVKRDIKLLEQVNTTATDDVTVLDISLDKNRTELIRILNQGTSVFYADHHYAGDIPKDNNLAAHINTSPDVCTAMIINALLNDEYILWAITGAFGDNLNNSAKALTTRTELKDEEIEQLQQLGILINYNGYGANLDDLHCPPTELYRELIKYSNPLEFCDPNNDIFKRLSDGYVSDFDSIKSVSAKQSTDTSAIYILPNEAWARRVSGIYSNQLANNSPNKAHAVLTEKANGNYLVSIRAPLNNKTGADEFCRRYPSGGGRAAAAGINDLSADQLEQMMSDFDLFYNQS